MMEGGKFGLDYRDRRVNCFWIYPVKLCRVTHREAFSSLIMLAGGIRTHSFDCLPKLLPSFVLVLGIALDSRPSLGCWATKEKDRAKC